jgi:hypothetical protein
MISFSRVRRRTRCEKKRMEEEDGVSIEDELHG